MFAEDEETVEEVAKLVASELLDEEVPVELLLVELPVEFITVRVVEASVPTKVVVLADNVEADIIVGVEETVVVLIVVVVGRGVVTGGRVTTKFKKERPDSSESVMLPT